MSRSTSPPVDPRAAYFDGIADRWDDWEDLPDLAARLASGLAELAVGRDERVLDVGCGTGNLTLALTRWLAPAGRIVAVDISPRMVERARAKVGDRRVTWHVAAADRLPLAAASIDRAICLSVWPHVSDRGATAAELRRVLRPGGALHVWHLASRERINDVHADAHAPAIRHDVLPSGAESARLLRETGFLVGTVVDDEQRYLITASRPDPPSAG